MTDRWCAAISHTQLMPLATKGSFMLLWTYTSINSTCTTINSQQYIHVNISFCFILKEKSSIPHGSGGFLTRFQGSVISSLYSPATAGGRRRLRRGWERETRALSWTGCDPDPPPGLLEREHFYWKMYMLQWDLKKPDSRRAPNLHNTDITHSTGREIWCQPKPPS